LIAVDKTLLSKFQHLILPFPWPVKSALVREVGFVTSSDYFTGQLFRISAFQLSAFDIMFSLAREVFGLLLHRAAF